MTFAIPALWPLAPMIASASGVGFSSKPTATRAGEKVKISFTVSMPTDVEVAALGADGNIVRHLAAGVLGGPKPPPDPLKAGLAQTIEWDGRDDFGKPAQGGPFKIRVRAGTSVGFGSMIGGSSDTGTIKGEDGLAVDKDGNLYVKLLSDIGQHGDAGQPWQVRLFGKDGHYLKTLLPYPPSTDPVKATGFRLIDAGDGQMTPANSTPIYPVFYAFGYSMYPRVVNNQLVFIDYHRRQLNMFSLDGSNALKTVQMWSKEAGLKSPNWLTIQVAFSPDGKYAYYSNVAGTAYDGKKPEDIDPNWPQGRIYRQDLSKADADPVKFYDLELPDWETTQYWMPSAWDRKTAAAGIDVDSRGHLFVCDLVNQEVVEVSPDGKKIGSVKVPWPDKVRTSSKSDTLYVVSRAVSRGRRPAAELLKITGRGSEARIASRLALKGALGHSLALDESGEEPTLWLGGDDVLVRGYDRGAEIEVSSESVINRNPDAISFVNYIAVDREAEQVYVIEGRRRVWRFCGTTGAGGLTPIYAADLAVGPNGMVYAWGTTGGYQGPVARYGRDLKPAPLASGTHTYGSLYGRAGRGNSISGMDVDSGGRVFAVWGSNALHLRVYDAAGQIVDFPRKVALATGKETQQHPSLITGISAAGGAVRVDLAGNIYLYQASRLEDHVPPLGFEKDPVYLRCVGTVLKFGPAGGERSKDEGATLGFSGVIGAYPEVGPHSGYASGQGSCLCTKLRFDVDGFGRLYLPNAVTYKVSMRDNAGNEILRFGHYGNFDCEGPASAEPTPDIPLGWPIAASASDRHIYVGDALNHRLVRIDKRFAAEETCEVN